ncbi:hypothetical protein DFH06DRAFT_1326845 [Mycena polygramma]|nr:hypothetical protein DFH06DRAFT_1326845 [Mycena polygramma]
MKTTPHTLSQRSNHGAAAKRFHPYYTYPNTDFSALRLPPLHVPTTSRPLEPLGYTEASSSVFTERPHRLPSFTITPALGPQAPLESPTPIPARPDSISLAEILNPKPLSPPPILWDLGRPFHPQPPGTFRHVDAYRPPGAMPTPVTFEDVKEEPENLTLQAHTTVLSVRRKSPYFAMDNETWRKIQGGDTLRLSGQLKGHWLTEQPVCIKEGYTLVNIKEARHFLTTTLAIPMDLTDMLSPEPEAESDFELEVPIQWADAKNASSYR